MAETTALLFTGPADEAVPCADPEGGRSPADQCDPLPVDLSYLADGRAEEATAQPVVLIEKIVEPGELGRHATAHEEPVSALEAVLHAAIATIPPD